MARFVNEAKAPTQEQLKASVILTGASALRMMRAERRQMGYISWRDLDPDEERHILHTGAPDGCVGALRRGATGSIRARAARPDLRNLCSRCE